MYTRHVVVPDCHIGFGEKSKQTIRFPIEMETDNGNGTMVRATIALVFGSRRRRRCRFVTSSMDGEQASKRRKKHEYVFGFKTTLFSHFARKS